MDLDPRLLEVLEGAGYTHDDDRVVVAEAEADADPARRSETAPYEVGGIWSKGDLTVTAERNTQLGQTLPAVLVLDDGQGTRVALNPEDDSDPAGLLDELLALAEGDTSVAERRQAEAELRSLGYEEAKPGTFVKGAATVTLGLLLLLPGLVVRALLPALLALFGPAFFVDAYKKKLLDAVYGNTAVAPPSTLYTALSTTTPTQAGGNITEPSGNAYARVAKTNDATNWPGATTADPSVKGNGTTITFPQATGSWGTVTYWVEYDALTVGNPIDTGALTAGQAIANGTTASFAANALQSTLDG
jgi:hypothetical protein